MTGTRLVFIAAPGDAGPPGGGTTYVVLDTAWTPRSDDRADVIPVRPPISAVLRRHDLFGEALSRLDAWAHEAGLDEALLVDGVAWWYRIRPFVWYGLHEMILWRRVIGELERGGATTELEVPAGRPLLEAAARAAAPAIAATVTVVDGSQSPVAPANVGAPSGAPAPAPTSARGRHPVIRLMARIRRIVSRALPGASRSQSDRYAERLAALDERVRALAGTPDAMLSISYPRVFQVIETSDAQRMVDPQLAPVLDLLVNDGVAIGVIGLDLDHRRDGDWSAVAADAALIPASYVRVRWGRSADREIDSMDVATRIAATSVPLAVDGADLGPGIVKLIGGYLPGWLDGQRRLARQAERMIEEIRPAALFLNHEGNRTPWLAAARRCRCPVVAVQHGVIYPTHPVYRHARLTTLPLPDVTCVFGPYERDVLVEHGGYLASEVAVTGSPRPGQDGPADRDPAGLAEERRAVRDELSVADGDRILVVSSANLWLVRDVHVVDMVARTLGGPLPGIHVVIKQHPGETDEGPFRALLEGLAAAGGYSPPAVTIVRNIDLYRLLRAADAHLGLHSTVLTDAVVVGTPNLISIDQADGDLLGYVQAGVARPVRDVDDVRSALAHPQRAHPADRAAFLESHFREGDAGQRVAGVIRSAAVAARGRSW